MDRLELLCDRMIEYYRGDPKRIQHFIKVHDFARMIGLCEKLPPETMCVLEAAAYTHDIGIKPSEKKYGSSYGKYQELEGPEPARQMLKMIGFDDELTERVAYLIAHHHTYDSIDGVDYQILVEADFLVNLFEDDCPKSAALSARERIFKTPAGLRLLNTMYDI